jgi:uncharacterized protein YneF (UPF0154 family)
MKIILRIIVIAAFVCSGVFLGAIAGDRVQSWITRDCRSQYLTNFDDLIECNKKYKDWKVEITATAILVSLVAGVLISRRIR